MVRIPAGPTTEPTTLPQFDPPHTESLTTRVLEVVEALRPMIQRDGGDIELVSITPAKVVQIRFQGACVGCPSSEMTLRMGIEDNLRTHVPEITGVEAVD
jgi:Fe-S cluster biogenesis protein NfuA